MITSVRLMCIVKVQRIYDKGDVDIITGSDSGDSVSSGVHTG